MSAIIRVLHGFIFPSFLEDVEINSYVCSTTGLFHYWSCQATKILYQDQKCRHSLEEYFSFMVSMEQRDVQKVFKSPTK